MTQKIMRALGLKQGNTSFQVSDWQKVKMLWPIVPPEARWQLVEWFVFNPRELNRRFTEEMKFQLNLRNMRKN